MRARAGTLVLKPNQRARRCVEIWAQHCENAGPGEDDETALARAILSTSVATIQQLDRKWRAMAAAQ
jgi:hypothetical protein